MTLEGPKQQYLASIQPSPIVKMCPTPTPCSIHSFLTAPRCFAALSIHCCSAVWETREPGVFCMLRNCLAMSLGSFRFMFFGFVVAVLRQGLIKLPKQTLNSLCSTNSLLIHDSPALVSTVPAITVLFN